MSNSKVGRNTRRTKTGLDESIDEKDEQYCQQTEEQKRQVRNKIREIYQRLQECKDQRKSGEVNEEELQGLVSKINRRVVYWRPRRIY